MARFIDICEDAITEIKARDSEIIDIESNHAMYFGDDHPIHGDRMQRSRYAQNTINEMKRVVEALRYLSLNYDFDISNVFPPIIYNNLPQYREE